MSDQKLFTIRGSMGEDYDSYTLKSNVPEADVPDLMLHYMKTFRLVSAELEGDDKWLCRRCGQYIHPIDNRGCACHPWQQQPVKVKG